MKYYLTLLIPICLIVILSACSQNNSTQTEEIKNYMQEVFNEDLPGDSTLFIFIPDYHCSTCLDQYLADFEKHHEAMGHPDICMILTGNTSDILQKSKIPYKVMIDENGIMNYYETYCAGITEILVVHEQINTLVQL
jgi:hypothetical protein